MATHVEQETTVEPEVHEEQATDEEVTLPPRQLAEDAKHGMQPPQFRPPPQFLEPPQLMTMQQHNMVVNTLMMGGTLDLRWSRFTAWGPERIPLLNLPKYGILAGIPVEWDHGRLCIQRRRIPMPGLTHSLELRPPLGPPPQPGPPPMGPPPKQGPASSEGPTASQERSEEEEEADPSVPFPHRAYAGLTAKQPPRLWLDAQAQRGLHGQPQQPGRPPAAAYGVPQQHQGPLPVPATMSQAQQGLMPTQGPCSMAQGCTPTVAKGARPKRVAMQPPSQQSVDVETLSHMLRMTGELREEATMCLRTVPDQRDPPQLRKQLGQQGVRQQRALVTRHWHWQGSGRNPKAGCQ